jgi:hypothetical protein
MYQSQRLPDGTDANALFFTQLTDLAQALKSAVFFIKRTRAGGSPRHFIG